MRPTSTLRALPLAALLAASCGAPPHATPAEIAAAARPAIPPPPPEPAIPPPRLAGDALRIHQPRELDAFDDLARIRDLDLALSEVDRVDLAVADDEAGDLCAGLDLRALAGRLPGLRRLRISGCQAAVHAGLDSFAELEELELVDLALDGVTMGRLLALPRLRALTLSRVSPSAESQAALRSLPIERLTLRELAPESPLAQLVATIPSLRAVELHGGWASHKTMLQVAKAGRLRELVLRDTAIGNFSLNQVKGLSHLARIDLRGPTFNDSTPLYLRDLPIESFTCACPSLGDVGLRALRHSASLRRVVLLASRISGATIESLADLAHLEALVIHGRDIGRTGVAALAGLTHLRALELEVRELSDPTLGGLGALVELRELTLRCPQVDDRIAGELASLTRLEALDLGGTAISDAGLAALAEMRALRRLILHHTRVTNRGLAHLAGLASLEVLELDHTDVVDAGVAHLAGLAALRELRLDGTLITDRALTTIAGLTSLERLNLAGTVVTADGVALLAGLDALTSVNLEGTRATTQP